MGGIAFCLEGTHTQTGFCRDNDNSILEPPSYSSGEKEKCSRGRHGTGGLAAILNSLPIPFPWGWSHSQCTVEVKRFCEEEWLVQGLRARRSRAGIQSQRSISLPNPHSFWRAKVNTTQKRQGLLCILFWPLKKQPKKMGKIKTELIPTYLGPCSPYSALPQSPCVFTSCSRKSGSLRWSPQTYSYSSYTPNPEKDSRKEDGCCMIEDVIRRAPVLSGGQGVHHTMRSTF